MNKKIYPIGIQNFEKLIKDGYAYVDKTAMIYQLASSGSYYFLSRPRRFGKSLLISTMQAYFEGKQELFAGLSIEKLEKEWVRRPVLHLDLNPGKYDTLDSLDSLLNNALTLWEREYGADASETSLPLRFAGIIRRAAQQTGHRVAILIDEYDKPLLQSIGNDTLQDAFRFSLQAFYGVMKSSDAYIKLAFLTGVTKFGKLSVFSTLNNLINLSMSPRYATLCGITGEELHHYFEDDIRELAETSRMNYEDCCNELKRRYDGYHFVEDSPGVYNPFSVLNTFFNMKFGSYWFETGTPTFLVELLKRYDYDLQSIVHKEISAQLLDNPDTFTENPIPVIYQSGYLTIKGVDKEFDNYILGFPNREVEEGFIYYLLPFYTGIKKGDSALQIEKFVREVRAGEINHFFSRLAGFFADIPYDLARKWESERHYQNILFIIFKLIGFYVKVEYHTSNARIDLILQTDRFVYVMEFKLDGTAEEALAQIKSRHYADPFIADGRAVIKIGVNFSRETRGIEKWIIEE